MTLGRFCRSGQWSLYIAQDLEKKYPGIRSHERPMSPSLSHFCWTEYSGFQSLD